MKLAWKFAFALWIGVLIVLASYSWVRVQREASLFDEDIRRDQRVLAHGLRAAVREVWKQAGRARGLAVLAAADQEYEGVKIRWVDDAAGFARDLELPSESVRRLSSGDSKFLQATLESTSFRSSPSLLNRPNLVDGGAVVVTLAMLPGSEGMGGAIILFESLAPRSAYVEQTLRNTLIASLVIAIVCAAVALLVGMFVVGRPVRMLIRQAQAIGAGESPPPLLLAQRDELGTLAHEMNGMTRQLGLARERSERDAQAKLNALEQLQHAERLTTLGRMASAIAHEVGTPLNVVSGHAKLLAQQRVMGQEALQSARTIAEQSERMTRMVRQLLDYARRRSPKRIETDLRDVVASAASLLEPIAKQMGIELQLELPEEPCLGVFDSSQLQQVLMNLVMNAVQASRRGQKVSLWVAREGARQGGVEPAWGICSVEDAGPGISTEQRERIFEPFFTTKASGEGTGLGLSIAREITRDHGGELSVGCAPGGGSRFQVRLPLDAS